MNHFTVDDAGRWAAGLCETDEAASLEAHALQCEPCHALLQHEARIELSLSRRGEGRGEGKTLRLARLAIVAIPLALAAAFALFMALPSNPLDRSSHDAGSPPQFASDDTHFHNESPPPEAFEAKSPFSL